MNLEKNLTKVVNMMDQHSQMEENTYKNSLISLENDIDTLKRNHAKGNSSRIICSHNMIVSLQKSLVCNKNYTKRYIRWVCIYQLPSSLAHLYHNIFVDYTNCKDYFDEGINKSGQYYILKNGAVIQVSCFFEGMDYETCYDYFKVGFNSSGLYYVYVDGISYQINCNFESGMSYDTKEKFLCRILCFVEWYLD